MRAQGVASGPEPLAAGQTSPLTPRVLTDEQIHSAFSRMVRKQDYWRSYLGYEIEDEEVLDWLDRAEAALERERRL